MDTACRIAQLALSTFDSLPAKCKPRVHPDGRREWTPMSAIIIALGNESFFGTAWRETEHSGLELRCVALATGTKCLHASAVKRSNGQILHDCHAEVLAFRGLNCWLLKEIKRVLTDDDYISPCIRYNSDKTTTGDMCQDVTHQEHSRPFEIRPEVAFYLFSTTAPCGDASMELLMSSKAPDDAVPWSADNLQADLETGLPLGRGHFSLLGAVRRKPARADAEATMSKSCTDKIALKQVLGLVSFPTDFLIRRTDQVFLKGLVVHSDQFSNAGYSRAFGREGRMQFVERLGGKHFDVHVLPDDFQRFVFERDTGNTPKVTNLSALMVDDYKKDHRIVEVLVNGVKQGHKQFDHRSGKSSVTSRASMMRQMLEICALIKQNNIPFKDTDDGFVSGMYSGWKKCDPRRERLVMKAEATKMLGGWVTNAVEDDFDIVAT